MSALDHLAYCGSDDRKHSLRAERLRFAGYGKPNSAVGTLSTQCSRRDVRSEANDAVQVMSPSVNCPKL